MKKHELIFSLLKIPLDFIIIFYSFFLARNIRLVNDFIPWIKLENHNITNEFLLWFALLWAIICITLFFIHNLYNLKISNSKIKEVLDIIHYLIYWFLFFSIIVYFWKWFVYTVEIPRLIILYSMIISIILIIIQRLFLNNLQNFLLEKKIIEKRKIVLINNKKDDKIKDILRDIKKAKIYEIIWYINLCEFEWTKYKYLGNDKKIKDIFENNKFDEILYIDSDFNQQQQFLLWDYSRIFWIRYRYIANWFDVTKTNTTVSLLNKIAVIEIKNTPIDSWARVIKRVIDLISSIILIISLFPIFILIWILIKLEDPKWPVVYKNRRVWQNWKIFNLYKFRYIKWEYCVKDSYWVNEKDDKALEIEKELIKKSSTRNWPLYKIKNDPRKTKVWNFIERYSIDELPQIFNVLLWNMSLVGPRPHQPREVDKYELYQKRVLTIKPWITWLAQVNWRDKNTFDDEVNLDITYIENWNFLLDIKIIFKTFNTIINR